MVAFVAGPCSGQDAAALVLRRLAKPKQAKPAKAGGARRDRTDDLMLAKHALSQLSYGPVTTPNNTLRSPQHADPKFTLGRPPSLALKARQPSLFVGLAEPRQAKPAKAGGPGKT